MSLINKYTKLKKISRLTDVPIIQEKGKNDGWSIFQTENGNDWIYETYAPVHNKYKHAALVILDDGIISLMGFNSYEDMCNDAGWDIDKQPDLDNMSNGEEFEGNQGERYIKLF